MFSPPRMIMSLDRPTILQKPCSSIVAMSLEQETQERTLVSASLGWPTNSLGHSVTKHLLSIYYVSLTAPDARSPSRNKNKQARLQGGGKKSAPHQSHSVFLFIDRFALMAGFFFNHSGLRSNVPKGLLFSEPPQPFPLQ